MLLLILEVGLLLTGLDETSFRTPSSIASEHKRVGRLERTQNQVRRKEVSTLVWSESQPQDALYEMDSVLTLKESSAELALEGGTRLKLDQNTLVVLETVSTTNAGGLRIRFSRGGLRTRSKDGPIAISGESFVLAAEKGSSLSLMELADGRLSVEIEEGKAVLTSGPLKQEMSSGESVLLKEGEIEQATKRSEEIAFAPGTPTRLYAKSFPAEVTFAWRGNPKQVRVVEPDRTLSRRLVGWAGKTQTQLSLQRGSTRLTLENEGASSETITVEVRPYPALRAFQPAARDRKPAGEVRFAWQPDPSAVEYSVEISREESFNTIVHEAKTSVANAKVALADPGAYYWRVALIDDRGERVLGNVSTFTITPASLAPPRLKAPEIREPAGQDGAQLRSGRGKFSWLSLVFPHAHAAGRALEAVFSWEPTPGADHYVIEISATPGFETQVVQEKVSGTSFVWRTRENKIHYWRVASGSGSELGVFSQTEVVKLEPAKTAKSLANAVPGALPRSVAGGAPAQASAKAGGAPADAASAPADNPARTARPIARAPAAASDALEPDAFPIAQHWEAGKVSFAKESRRTVGRFIYHPVYRAASARNELKVEGNFAGFAPTSFGIELYLGPGDGARLELAADYEEATWTPKSSPRQSELKEQRAQGTLSYRPFGSWFSYGVGAETYPVLARKASEEVELIATTLYGFSMRYTRPWSDSTLDTSVDLRTGGGLVGVRLSGVWTYSLGRGDGARYEIGPRLVLEVFKASSEKSASAASIGAHLSLGW